MKYNEASIYWIHLLEHSDHQTQGYIGVSQNPDRRFQEHLRDVSNHKHKNIHFTYAVEKYGKENLIMELILSGEESFCYEIAEIIRPNKNVGWNIAPGGHRGPGWTKGKKRSPESVTRIIANNKIRKEARKAQQTEARRIRMENKRIEKERKIKIINENRELKKKKRELRVIKQAEARKRREEARKNKELLSSAALVNYLPRTKNKGPKKNRPICTTCNKNVCAINYTRAGVVHYRSMCDECGRKKNSKPLRKANWIKSGYKKKTTCDICGFHSVYPSQIVVYYIDGNLENTKFDNLKSICLNCVEVVKKREINWKRGDLVVDWHK